MGDENERSGSNSDSPERRLRASVADRIRARTNRGDSGGGSGGNQGRNSGGESGKQVVFTDGGAIESSGGAGSGISGSQRETVTEFNSTRKRDEPSNGGGGTGSDSRGNSSSSNGVSPREEEQLATDSILRELELETPSLIKVTEIKTTGTGKRGRPKGSVNFGSTTRKSKNLDIILPLKIACAFVFNIPVYLGWGSHWELDESETEELSTSLKDVLDAFPSQTTIDFLKYLDKVVPILVLGMNLYQLTKIRILKTRALFQEQQRLANENQQGKEGRATEYPM